MEPRHEESPKAREPSVAQRPKRFRIVKLEERIAPAKSQPMAGTRGCSGTCAVCSVYCTLTCACPTLDKHCSLSPGHCK
jgi:hypothetical protein